MYVFLLVFTVTSGVLTKTQKRKEKQSISVTMKPFCVEIF